MALIALSASLSLLDEAPRLPDAIPPPKDVIRADQQPEDFAAAIAKSG